MHYFNVFSFFLLTSASNIAPSIDVEMSQLIMDQNGGNLAIHFVEGVSEERATDIVEELDYKIVTVDFNGVMVFGECHALLTADESRKVLSHEKIVDFNQNKMGSPGLGVPGNVRLKNLPGVLVSLRFKHGVSQVEARNIAKSFSEFNVKSVSGSSRDISIDVEKGSEEEAVEKLQALEEVEYVVYLRTELFPELLEEGQE